MKLLKIIIKKVIGKNMAMRMFLLKIRGCFVPDKRFILAREYLRGNGIELGALNMPLIVSSRAKVKYVDRLPVEDLRKQSPELNDWPLVNVDIIDDGEKLDKIAPESQDFLIANHMLEHCQNPINTIKSFLRVLRKNGILYLTLPDKRANFDAVRPVTSLEHLIKDYRQGPECSRKEHYLEWAKYICKKTDGEIAVEAERLLSENYNMHFHVWTYFELFELMNYLKSQLDFNFDILAFVYDIKESIFIIRKN